MKTDNVIEVLLHTFLSSAVDGSGQLHTLETLPQENSPSVNRIDLLC
jgi:hypothetical protein